MRPQVGQGRSCQVATGRSRSSLPGPAMQTLLGRSRERLLVPVTQAAIPGQLYPSHRTHVAMPSQMRQEGHLVSAQHSQRSQEKLPGARIPRG